MSQIVIGTAGHIDHGKTSLVKSLTGTDTDSLIDEKERGMTIDLGFAYINKSITIIDVPGHEKFIRNMVAGAASIHFGLIVVAADDGVMPQTIEHIDILTLLGVYRGWVVITKTDLISDKDWIDLIELDVYECLTSRGFKPLSINRVNNLNGDGIEQLKFEILSSVEQNMDMESIGHLRMNIDRFFSKKGFGTVVTGTILNGMAKIGDEVEILPSQTKSKIRGIHSHGGSQEMVKTGDRAAFNLTNVKSNIFHRGSVLCTPGVMTTSKIIIAHIRLINSTKWSIKNKQRLRFHFGTSVVLGRVKTIELNKLKKATSSNVIIYLESDIVTSMDDRFVIRSYSPMETIGGGTVLFVNPLYRWKKVRNFAKNIPVPASDRFGYLVDYEWKTPKSIDRWKSLFLNSSNEIESWLENFGLKMSNNCIVYSTIGEKRAKDHLIQYFNECYEKNPFRMIINSESIIRSLGWSKVWLRIIIARLMHERIIKDIKGGYSLLDYKRDLSQKDQVETNQIENIILRSDFKPLLIIDIIQSSKMNQKRVGDLLHVLITQKKIIGLGKSFFIHFEHFDSIINALKEFFYTNPNLSVGDFKKLLGLTRKTAIPLLEYLDNNNYTNRKENIRTIGEALNE